MGGEVDAGLVAIYKDGRQIKVRPVIGEAAKNIEWRSMVRQLGAQLDPTRRLHAVAAIEVRPRSAS